MRLRSIPRFPKRPLTVALASRVEGAVHAGAVIADAGQWIANGWLDKNGTCRGDCQVNCCMMEQVRLLHRFLYAAVSVRYRGGITVQTDSPDVAALLLDWRRGLIAQAGMFVPDAQNWRRQIRSYPGGFGVVLADSSEAEPPLVTLAKGLGDVVFSGLSGAYDRNSAAHRAWRLVAESLPKVQ